MTKDYHITQEEAERLAKDCGALIYTFGGSPFSGTVFSFEFRSPEQLQAYINTALDKVLGEPVGEVYRNETGQISMKKPNGSQFDISEHVGTKLYAPKELK